MKRKIEYLLALLLVPLAGVLLYHNRHAWRPYDPMNDANFPFASDSEARDWRAIARRHGWLLDYAEARQRAAETRKPLMVVIRCIP